MLWTIAVVLVILWLLGLVNGYTMGNFIHILRRAFEFAKTENKLILNVDKEKLKAAPGFD